MKNVRFFIFITTAYILAHGLTVYLIAPVQSIFLPEITQFASLIYLPHGVRILSTWLWGGKAVAPLFLGGLMSAVVFDPEEVKLLLGYHAILGVAAGSVAALVAFEIMKLFGCNLYSGHNYIMNWKLLLVLGAIASIVNSLGAVVIYTGRIVPELEIPVLFTYAIGDTIGLFVCMIALMLVFRWIRLFSAAGTDD